MLSLSLGLVALNHTRPAIVGFLVAVAVFPIALQFPNGRSCKSRSVCSPPRRLVPLRRVSCCASSSPVTGRQVECRLWPNRRDGARACRLGPAGPSKCESRATPLRSPGARRFRDQADQRAERSIRASRTPRPPRKNPMATVIAPATDSASAWGTSDRRRSPPQRGNRTRSPQASPSRRGWRARGGRPLLGPVEWKTAPAPTNATLRR